MNLKILVITVLVILHIEEKQTADNSSCETIPDHLVGVWWNTYNGEKLTFRPRSYIVHSKDANGPFKLTDTAVPMDTLRCHEASFLFTALLGTKRSETSTLMIYQCVELKRTKNPNVLAVKAVVQELKMHTIGELDCHTPKTDGRRQYFEMAFSRSAFMPILVSHKCVDSKQVNTAMKLDSGFLKPIICGRTCLAYGYLYMYFRSTECYCGLLPTSSIAMYDNFIKSGKTTLLSSDKPCDVNKDSNSPMFMAHYILTTTFPSYEHLYIGCYVVENSEVRHEVSHPYLCIQICMTDRFLYAQYTKNRCLCSNTFGHAGTPKTDCTGNCDSCHSPSVGTVYSLASILSFITVCPTSQFFLGEWYIPFWRGSMVEFYNNAYRAMSDRMEHNHNFFRVKGKFVQFQTVVCVSDKTARLVAVIWCKDSVNVVRQCFDLYMAKDNIHMIASIREEYATSESFITQMDCNKPKATEITDLIFTRVPQKEEVAFGMPEAPPRIDVPFVSVTPLGCAEEDVLNWYINAQAFASPGMGVDDCAQMCYAQSMTVFSVFGGHYCHCGTRPFLPKFLGLLQRCPFEVTSAQQWCGDHCVKVAVYRSALAAGNVGYEKEAAVFLACSKIFTGVNITTTGSDKSSMTIDWCIGWCREKKYKYAGLQVGKTCACNNGFSSVHTLHNGTCFASCNSGWGSYCGGATGEVAVYQVRPYQNISVKVHKFLNFDLASHFFAQTNCEIPDVGENILQSQTTISYIKSENQNPTSGHGANQTTKLHRIKRHQSSAKSKSSSNQDDSMMPSSVVSDVFRLSEEQEDILRKFEVVEPRGEIDGVYQVMLKRGVSTAIDCLPHNSVVRIRDATITWWRGKMKPITDGRFILLETGALEIKDAEPEDTGLYTCDVRGVNVITNDADEVQYQHLITVYSMPDLFFTLTFLYNMKNCDSAAEAYNADRIRTFVCDRLDCGIRHISGKCESETVVKMDLHVFAPSKYVEPDCAPKCIAHSIIAALNEELDKVRRYIQRDIDKPEPMLNFMDSSDNMLLSLECEGGFYRSETCLCLPCLPGTFATEEMDECRKCPIGFFQPGFAMDKCISCPDDTNITKIGSRHREDCKKDGVISIPLRQKEIIGGIAIIGFVAVLCMMCGFVTAYYMCGRFKQPVTETNETKSNEAINSVSNTRRLQKPFGSLAPISSLGKVSVVNSNIVAVQSKKSDITSVSSRRTSVADASNNNKSISNNNKRNLNGNQVKISNDKKAKIPQFQVAYTAKASSVVDKHSSIIQASALSHIKTKDKTVRMREDKSNNNKAGAGSSVSNTSDVSSSNNTQIVMVKGKESTSSTLDDTLEANENVIACQAEITPTRNRKPKSDISTSLKAQQSKDGIKLNGRNPGGENSNSVKAKKTDKGIKLTERKPRGENYISVIAKQPEDGIKLTERKIKKSYSEKNYDSLKNQKFLSDKAPSRRGKKHSDSTAKKHKSKKSLNKYYDTSRTSESETYSSAHEHSLTSSKKICECNDLVASLERADSVTSLEELSSTASDCRMYHDTTGFAFVGISPKHLIRQSPVRKPDNAGLTSRNWVFSSPDQSSSEMHLENVLSTSNMKDPYFRKSSNELGMDIDYEYQELVPNSFFNSRSQYECRESNQWKNPVWQDSNHYLNQNLKDEKLVFESAGQTLSESFGSDTTETLERLTIKDCDSGRSKQSTGTLSASALTSILGNRCLITSPATHGLIPQYDVDSDHTWTCSPSDTSLAVEDLEDIGSARPPSSLHQHQSHSHYSPRRSGTVQDTVQEVQHHHAQINNSAITADEALGSVLIDSSESHDQPPPDESRISAMKRLASAVPSSTLRTSEKAWQFEQEFIPFEITREKSSGNLSVQNNFDRGDNVAHSTRSSTVKQLEDWNDSLSSHTRTLDTLSVHSSLGTYEGVFPNNTEGGEVESNEGPVLDEEYNVDEYFETAKDYNYCGNHVPVSSNVMEDNSLPIAMPKVMNEYAASLRSPSFFGSQRTEASDEYYTSIYSVPLHRSSIKSDQHLGELLGEGQPYSSPSSSIGRRTLGSKPLMNSFKTLHSDNEQHKSSDETAKLQCPGVETPSKKLKTEPQKNRDDFTTRSRIFTYQQSFMATSRDTAVSFSEQNFRNQLHRSPCLQHESGISDDYWYQHNAIDSSQMATCKAVQEQPNATTDIINLTGDVSPSVAAQMFQFDTTSRKSVEFPEIMNLVGGRSPPAEDHMSHIDTPSRNLVDAGRLKHPRESLHNWNSDEEYYYRLNDEVKSQLDLTLEHLPQAQPIDLSSRHSDHSLQPSSPDCSLSYNSSHLTQKLIEVPIGINTSSTEYNNDISPLAGQDVTKNDWSSHKIRSERYWLSDESISAILHGQLNNVLVQPHPYSVESQNPQVHTVQNGGSYKTQEHPGYLEINPQIFRLAEENESNIMVENDKKSQEEPGSHSHPESQINTATEEMAMQEIVFEDPVTLIPQDNSAVNNLLSLRSPSWITSYAEALKHTGPVSSEQAVSSDNNTQYRIKVDDEHLSESAQSHDSGSETSASERTLSSVSTIRSLFERLSIQQPASTGAMDNLSNNNINQTSIAININNSASGGRNLPTPDNSSVASSDYNTSSSDSDSENSIYYPCLTDVDVTNSIKEDNEVPGRFKSICDEEPSITTIVNTEELDITSSAYEELGVITNVYQEELSSTSIVDTEKSGIANGKPVNSTDDENNVPSSITSVVNEGLIESITEKCCVTIGVDLSNIKNEDPGSVFSARDDAHGIDSVDNEGQNSSTTCQNEEIGITLNDEKEETSSTTNMDVPTHSRTIQVDEGNPIIIDSDGNEDPSITTNALDVQPNSITGADDQKERPNSTTFVYDEEPSSSTNIDGKEPDRTTSVEKELGVDSEECSSTTSVVDEGSGITLSSQASIDLDFENHKMLRAARKTDDETDVEKLLTLLYMDPSSSAEDTATSPVLSSDSFNSEEETVTLHELGGRPTNKLMVSQSETMTPDSLEEAEIERLRFQVNSLPGAGETTAMQRTGLNCCTSEVITAKEVKMSTITRRLPQHFDIGKKCCLDRDSEISIIPVLSSSQTASPVRLIDDLTTSTGYERVSLPASGVKTDSSNALSVKSDSPKTPLQTTDHPSMTSNPKKCQCSCHKTVDSNCKPSCKKFKLAPDWLLISKTKENSGTEIYHSKSRVYSARKSSSGYNCVRSEPCEPSLCKDSKPAIQPSNENVCDKKQQKQSKRCSDPPLSSSELSDLAGHSPKLKSKPGHQLFPNTSDEILGDVTNQKQSRMYAAITASHQETESKPYHQSTTVHTPDECSGGELHQRKSRIYTARSSTSGYDCVVLEPNRHSLCQDETQQSTGSLTQTSTCDLSEKEGHSEMQESKPCLQQPLATPDENSGSKTALHQRSLPYAHSQSKSSHQQPAKYNPDGNSGDNTQETHSRTYSIPRSSRRYTRVPSESSGHSQCHVSKLRYQQSAKRTAGDDTNIQQSRIYSARRKICMSSEPCGHSQCKICKPTYMQSVNDSHEEILPAMDEEKLVAAKSKYFFKPLAPAIPAQASNQNQHVIQRPIPLLSGNRQQRSPGSVWTRIQPDTISNIKVDKRYVEVPSSEDTPEQKAKPSLTADLKSNIYSWHNEDGNQSKRTHSSTSGEVNTMMSEYDESLHTVPRNRTNNSQIVAPGLPNLPSSIAESHMRLMTDQERSKQNIILPARSHQLDHSPIIQVTSASSDCEDQVKSLSESPQIVQIMPSSRTSFRNCSPVFSEIRNISLSNRSSLTSYGLPESRMSQWTSDSSGILDDRSSVSSTPTLPLYSPEQC